MVSYISPLKKIFSLPTSKRRVVVLGSTGSIGRNTLEVIYQHKDRFEVIGLAAGKNIKLLKEQIFLYKPKYVSVLSKEHLAELKTYVGDEEIVFLWGEKGCEEIASLDEVDLVVNGISGAFGLRPLIASLKRGKIVALANKESLVMAGPIVRDICNRYEAEILPVDSEHNAIFQCISGHNFGDVLNLCLTASGGPFWDKDILFLSQVTPEMALKHPNWDMGKKISIDSATLMNKALEVIEAHYLFGIELDRIKVLIHPQSIVHSFVEYIDGSIIAHMAVPDMKIPISFCLFYPERVKLSLRSLNLLEKELTFVSLDNNKFPSIKLAKESLKMGGSYPIVLNAANDIAVSLFLNRRINFLEIFEIVKRALDEHIPVRIKEIEDVLEVDRATRKKVMRWLG